MAHARRTHDAADFHAWRKLVKLQWYQLRLVGPIDAAVRKELRLLHRVERWLGDDHDVVMLCGELFGDSRIVSACHDLDLLRRAAARFQETLRRRAMTASRQIYARPDEVYLRRLHRSWRAQRS